MAANQLKLQDLTKSFVLLTNERCPRCVQFGMLLSVKGIPFTKELINQEQHMEKVKELKLRSLPIFKLGNEYIQYTTKDKVLSAITEYLEIS